MFHGLNPAGTRCIWGALWLIVLPCAGEIISCRSPDPGCAQLLFRVPPKLVRSGENGT